MKYKMKIFFSRSIWAFHSFVCAKKVKLKEKFLYKIMKLQTIFSVFVCCVFIINFVRVYSSQSKVLVQLFSYTTNIFLSTCVCIIRGNLYSLVPWKRLQSWKILIIWLREHDSRYKKCVCWKKIIFTRVGRYIRWFES